MNRYFPNPELIIQNFWKIPVKDFIFIEATHLHPVAFLETEHRKRYFSNI